MKIVNEIIKDYTLDLDQCHLSVSVSEDFDEELRNKLKTVVQPKSLFNTIRLYVFLLWMNSMGLTYVPREDLAAMAFSKHNDRLSKAINALKTQELLLVNQRMNVNNCWFHNSYIARPCIKFDPLLINIKEYDYEIQEQTIITFQKRGIINVRNVNFSLSSKTNPVTSMSCATDLYHESANDGKDFINQFTSWYEELIIPNYLNSKGHFSTRDGRFYHVFHHLSKEYRESAVLWDNENVVEVWDAHSAFFIVLCYYLKEVKEYVSEEEKIAFINEANRMLSYTLHDELYDAVKNYCISINAWWGTTRDAAKELCQIYKNTARDTIFRKSDGQLKNIWWARRFKGIDDFFRMHFPHLRDMFLDYPRHIEEDLRHKISRYDSETHQLVVTYRMKKVSNLQDDIMPYEFNLISLGLCKDLYEQYGIKTLTVHDAIYMKVTDADKGIDINAILRKRLGVTTLSSTPLF